LKNKFPSIHWDAGNLAHNALLNIFNNRKIFTGYDESFRVFSDMMWINNKIDFQVNKFFKIMDADYPNSYFIYNFRDEQKWLNSRINHDISNRFPLTKLSLLVNNTQDIEELKNIWITERRRFEEDLRSYFKDRKKKVDAMNLRFEKIKLKSLQENENLESLLEVDDSILTNEQQQIVKKYKKSAADNKRKNEEINENKNKKITTNNSKISNYFQKL
jgi:hypothetical protein